MNSGAGQGLTTTGHSNITTTANTHKGMGSSGSWGNNIARKQLIAQRQAKLKTAFEKRNNDRLWELLDGGLRRRIVELICDDVEAEHGAAVRRSEAGYLLMWLLVATGCWMVGSGAVGIVVAIAGLAAHGWALIRPALPYSSMFDDADRLSTRRKFLEGTEERCPKSHIETNLERIRSTILSGTVGYLPARCLEWGEAERLGVHAWVDKVGGPGGAAMAKVLAKQERNRSATLDDLITVIRKIGGEVR
jgi:hypothetical protein